MNKFFACILFCFCGMAHDSRSDTLNFKLSDGCLDFANAAGFTEIETANFSGDSYALATTRLFLKNDTKNRESTIVVSIGTDFKTMGCSKVLSVSWGANRIRISSSSPPYGWLAYEKNNFLKPIRSFEKKCLEMRKKDPALELRHDQFIEHETGAIYGPTEGGTCENFANSTAIRFVVSSGNQHIIVTTAGYEVYVKKGF